MQRRSFLQGLQGGLALGALGLAGCAAPTSGVPAKARVLVVGGGYGGATAAKYVRMLSDQKIDVVLVDPNEAFISCPISNLVLGGSRQMTDITVPYTVLTSRHGVRVVKDTVASIDAAKKVAVLASGPSIAYDKLVLSPGVDLMMDSITGLQRSACRRSHPAGVEGRAGDGGVAQAARGDARRRRLRDHDPRSAVPLPARAVRARVPGGELLQGRQAEQQGADPRREPGCHVEGPAVQEGVDRAIPGHRRVPRPASSDRRRRRLQASSSSRCRTR